MPTISAKVSVKVNWRMAATFWSGNVPRILLPSYLLLGTCTGILKKPKNGLFWGVLDGGGGSVRIKISARFARGGVQVHFILGVAVGSVRE